MEMKWFDLWLEDRRCMAETMRRNMQADIDAGWNPQGHAIRKQLVEVEEYEMETDRQVERFKYMEEKQVNRWCYFDMKKRGAI